MCLATFFTVTASLQRATAAGGVEGAEQVQRKKKSTQLAKNSQKIDNSFCERLAKTQQVAKYLYSDAQWQLKCNAHGYSHR